VGLQLLLIAKSWSQGTAGGRRLFPASVLAVGMPGYGDETHQHVALHCPHYAVMRAQLREQLVCEVGEEKVRSWEELGDEQQYQALLSDYFWGVNADSPQPQCGCE
jgi:hypothetical protein